MWACEDYVFVLPWSGVLWGGESVVREQEHALQTVLSLWMLRVQHWEL